MQISDVETILADESGKKWEILNVKPQTNTEEIFLIIRFFFNEAPKEITSDEYDEKGEVINSFTETKYQYDTIKEAIRIPYDTFANQSAFDEYINSLWDKLKTLFDVIKQK